MLLEQLDKAMASWQRKSLADEAIAMLEVFPQRELHFCGD